MRAIGVGNFCIVRRDGDLRESPFIGRYDSYVGVGVEEMLPFVKDISVKIVDFNKKEMKQH